VPTGSRKRRRSPRRPPSFWLSTMSVNHVSISGAGIDEDAELVTGGLGRPEHVNRGWFLRPTVFGGVRNDMTIAREQIFGPVLAILPCSDEEDAIVIANDTPYGPPNAQSGDPEQARGVAGKLRAGNIFLNHPVGDTAAPFVATSSWGTAANLRVSRSEGDYRLCVGPGLERDRGDRRWGGEVWLSEHSCL
jgi:acyl-CoA reductase-like NAD-dependent aldehyde dehydrogenase